MKLFEKIAETLMGAPANDPAARTRALSRLGPPRRRFDGAMPA
jgi:hypothetical protein